MQNAWKYPHGKGIIYFYRGMCRSLHYYLGLICSLRLIIYNYICKFLNFVKLLKLKIYPFKVTLYNYRKISIKDEEAWISQ